MAVSPWAQLEQQSTTPQNLPPPVFASMPMTGPTPDLPASPAPAVARIPTPIEGNIANDQQKLEKIRWQQANPWGTEENHPGKLGKIAHVFSNVGNIAGDVFAPDVMAHIPGTQMNRDVQERQLTNRLNQENTENEQNLQREAMTAHENEETAEAPGKAQSAEALQGAQTEKTKADIGAENWKAIPGVIGPNGEPVEIEGKSGNVRFGGVSGTQPMKPQSTRPDTPEQQYIDEYQKTHPGSSVAAAERAYTLDTQKPPQIAPIMMMIPQPGGGATATVVRPGQTVAPGATTATQFGAENAPTAATRTMAETAPKVIDLANRTEQLIDQQINSLGPAASRWNEFMAGKVGAPNPEFTKLRTNVGLLQTALMRMHVGARGGEQIMHHFADLIDSSKQDPENLKAALGEIKAYATEVGHGGAAVETDRANVGAKEPQRPANVPEGYKFNANGSKGAGWYAPTAK